MSVVLVTGAGGAIGAAAVERLAADGRDVIAQDLTAATLEKVGPYTRERIAGDLTDRAHLGKLGELLAGVDLAAVLGAHGIPGAGALEALSRDRIRAILTINGVTIPDLFAVTRGALARGDGGAFVAISSQAALRGEPDNAVYCAAKRAVTAWVEGVAPLAAAEGIHVRALCPGRTEGPLLVDATEQIARDKGLTFDTYVASVMALIPLGRYARTDETAAAAVYLMDPRPGRPTILASSGGEVPF
jgi:NAD(P)-dependent dehydrogenase (short-subunit alcohol dehydrogenase family)